MRSEEQRWTEQQERLLRAAQDVVNDTLNPWDTLPVLRAVVQEISDDAVKAIEAIREAALESLGYDLSFTATEPSGDLAPDDGFEEV